MAKRLSNLEKHAVQNMLTCGEDIDSIVKNLKHFTKKTVESYIRSYETSRRKIEENNRAKKEEEEEETPAVVGGSATKDLMLTRTQGGKKGVAIMTQAAAQMSDETKKRTAKRSRTSKGAIYHIKEKKVD